ncbi:XdhC family protein [uncultured Jatrophihabitans sp.]|uniref:XdhC family protein n=1 Tax=uncultured Jatrophihabitans sp. TaxID=1610747 RepID=UPI0035CA3D7E
MYEIAEQVRTWLEAGRDVSVAQVMATQGFSSRDPVAAAAWTDADETGQVLDGVSTSTLIGRHAGLHEITISDDDAQRAGLSCGGRATVLVQPAEVLGLDVWDRLAAREPVLLVTSLQTGDVTSYTPQTVRDAPGAIPRIFGRGVSATELLAGDAVVSLWPVPTLVVVGDGLIADALAGAATLLGWSSEVTTVVDAAVRAAQRLHRSDAFVVLSHSREVDGPSLTAALAGEAGYVGALGSRRTQAARREWLTEHGVDAVAQARIHGPAGLDVDAHTPGEIAISIVAEILANRAQSSGGALRDRPGPVHTAGVNAPPPRYPG